MAGVSIADAPLELAYGAMDTVTIAQDVNAKICSSDPQAFLVSCTPLSSQKGKYKTEELTWQEGGTYVSNENKPVVHQELCPPPKNRADTSSHDGGGDSHQAG